MLGVYTKALKQQCTFNALSKGSFETMNTLLKSIEGKVEMSKDITQ
jgi:hypothetical protein